MGKVTGAYKSLVHGVSQQVPEQRQDGQHQEQVNVLSDPIRGIVRRQGTQRLAESALTVDAAGADDLAANYTEYDLRVEETNIALMTRRAGTSGTSDGIYAVWRSGANDGKLIPTVIAPDAVPFIDSGINGVAVAGRYLVMPHNLVTSSVETAVWGSVEQKSRSAVFVRGGSYAKPYKATIKFVGIAEIAATYTSPASSYPGTLNTSDIPYAATDYSKQVNDRVNAFNGLVTNWIGTAAAAIQPSAIAASLRTALNLAGLAAHATVLVVGAVIFITALAGKEIEYITVDDGGDGTQLKFMWTTVEAPSDLPPIAVPGTVIKVEPLGKEAYYLRAESDSPGTPKVKWNESFATSVALSNVFLLGTIFSGTLYVGKDPASLQAILPGGSGIDVPTLGNRIVGDDESSAVPHFAGHLVTHASMFQDRLVMCSGNVISASATGDYFNFWRSTVLSVVDSDPVEVFANGSEDDVIRHAVFFDRGLVLVGDRQQYALSGKLPLTPATASPIQSSAHKDIAGVRPVASGDYMFYSKAESAYSQVHQISVGAVDDTSNSIEVTQQLDSYIRGKVRNLTAVAIPDIIAVRTDEVQNGFYVFRFIDSQSKERLAEAWARWEFDDGCGKVVGLSVVQERLRIMFVRGDGVGGYSLVVDEARLTPGTNTLPCLDSQAQHDAYPYIAGIQYAWGADGISTRAWQGQADGDKAALTLDLGMDDLCRMGYPYPAYVELTSPFMRDRQDNPIIVGRTVVNSLTLSHANTGAYNVVVTTPYDTTTSLEFRGLTVNGVDSTVGERHLHKGRASAPVGRETRDYIATVSAFQWQPMAITALDWTGQIFNNARRV